MNLSDARIKVIGAGGIGTALIPTLARFLNFGMNGQEWEDIILTVIDGDTYEMRNLERQSFKEKGNKATVTVNELTKEFGEIDTRAIPEYIGEDNVRIYIREGDIVFLCVDNHATRKLVSDHCSKLQNVTIISGGNDLIDGNVQIYVRRNATDVTLPLVNQYHPEIERPNDTNPADFARTGGGCQERTQASPQLLITNFAIASLMLNAFYALIVDKLAYNEVFKDVVSNKTRTVIRSN